MALLPPNSKIVFPNLPPTTSPIRLPIRVLPVAEIRGTRLSLINLSPMVDPLPIIKLKIPL